MNATQTKAAVSFFAKHTKEKKVYVTNDAQVFFEHNKNLAVVHARSIKQTEIDLVDRADLKTQIEAEVKAQADTAKANADKVAADKAKK